MGISLDWFEVVIGRRLAIQSSKHSSWYFTPFDDDRPFVPLTLYSNLTIVHSLIDSFRSFLGSFFFRSFLHSFVESLAIWFQVDFNSNSNSKISVWITKSNGQSNPKRFDYGWARGLNLPLGRWRAFDCQFQFHSNIDARNRRSIMNGGRCW